MTNEKRIIPVLKIMTPMKNSLHGAITFEYVLLVTAYLPQSLLIKSKHISILYRNIRRKLLCRLDKRTRNSPCKKSGEPLTRGVNLHERLASCFT